MPSKSLILIPVLVFGPHSISIERDPMTDEESSVPIQGWCQGAIMNVRNGRVAVLGEAAMFSAQLAGATRQPMGMNAPGASQNYQLLLNIAHWLTRTEGMAN